MVVMDVNKKLDELYLDASNPGSFGGIIRLYAQAKKFKITRKQVVAYLQTRDGYTQHRPVRMKFQRRQIICVDTGDQHQIDLADMQKFSEFNNGFKYLLTVIDCFSRLKFFIANQFLGHRLGTSDLSL